MAVEQAVRRMAFLGCSSSTCMGNIGILVKFPRKYSC